MDSENNLTAWLHTQINHDERVALAAPGPTWVVGAERDGAPGRWRGVKADLVMLPPDGPFVTDLDVGAEVLRAEFVNDGKFAGRRAVEHAVLWDPARALAEVQAKRRVIQLYENALHAHQVGSVSLRNRTQDEAAVDVLGEAVKALGGPYAGRAGYREEWRP